MKPAFRVYFNEKEHWVDVYVAESPAKFKRKEKCYAYYIGADNRRQRRGLFGKIHLSQLDDSPLSIELMTHEIQHLFFDWWLCRKGNQMSTQNEERIAKMVGEFSRAFWRKYKGWSHG